MRLYPAVISLGLVGSLCEAARAPVYISGPSSQANNAAALSYEDARLYLAQRLGLSHAYDLGGASDSAIELLNQASNAQASLFKPTSEESGRRRTLVIVEGVDAPENFFSSRTPAFHIESQSSLGDNLNMVSTFLSQDREFRGTKEFCGGGIRTTEIKDSIQGGFSASDPLGICELDDVQSEDWWKALNFKQKIEFMGAPLLEISEKMFKKNVPGWMPDDVTAVFQIWTLDKKATKHSSQSSAPANAVKDIKAALGALLESASDATVVLMPPSQSSSKGKRSTPGLRNQTPARSNQRRQSEPSRTPKTTLPICYSEQSACELATNNCTGHGSCERKWTETDSDDERGAECWGCLCVPSTLRAPDADGHGGKTITWGGPACQKKDVSVPFWLFAGFGVAIAATVSYGIGMLLSIGQAELPSVLGAGVASVGARGK